MGIIKNYISILFLLILPFAVLAQDENVKQELTVHEINGKSYYIHIVEKGNTLYAISRSYAVTIEALQKENPRLTKELTIGDRLLIPISEVKRKDLDKSPEIDGNYLVHEVQKKNTLYSIAKEYHVEINDIVSANPALDEGLKKGMSIRIPVEKIKGDQKVNEYIEPATVSPYVTHLIQPKETLYSLSKEYGVSMDSIVNVNNGLVGGLKVNQLINIPILKNYEDTTKAETAIQYDSNAVKVDYTISLLLPLYLDTMLNIDSDTSYHESQKARKDLFAKAMYGLEFYQGFQMAADSLAKMGMNIELQVFDTNNDTAKVGEILRDSSLKKSDLLVGPLYLDAFLMAADYAKKNKINIVSPVKQSNKILLGNNYVSKVTTSEPVRVKFLARYMADSLSTKNMIMVYPDNFKDRSRAENLKKIYYEHLSNSSDTSLNTQLHELIWSPSEFGMIKKYFDSTQINVVVVPSNKQAFVTQFLTQLSLEDDYDFQVIGMESWQNFGNIDVNYLQDLGVHLVVSEFIDLESESVKAFEQIFYKQYKVIPEKYSYLGFDVGMYYLNLMHSYGLNLEVMFLGLQEEMLGRKIEFFKTGIESGYENHSVYLIQYADYRKKRLY